MCAWYIGIPGGDDRRVLLWNVEKALSDIGEPVVMKGEHNSNIFCLAINKTNTKIFSGGELFFFVSFYCTVLWNALPLQNA